MYPVAALKILYNSKFSHKSAAAKHTYLSKLMEIQTPSREPHVIHTVHVPLISIVSNKRISWYNTHDIHMFRHLGAILRKLLQQRCTDQTAITILFILIRIIRHWFVKIHKTDSNIVYSFMC